MNDELQTIGIFSWLPADTTINTLPLKNTTNSSPDSLVISYDITVLHRVAGNPTLVPPPPPAPQKYKTRLFTLSRSIPPQKRCLRRKA